MQQRGVVEQRLHEGAAPFELLRLPLAQQHSAVGYNEQTNKQISKIQFFQRLELKGFAFPFIALKAFGTARLRLRSQHGRGSG